MAPADELAALRDAGRLKEVPADVDAARQMHEQASANLRLVREILDRTDDPNPRAAALLLWDGGAFALLAAALVLAGFRVTSAVGHHRTAIEAVRIISGKGGLMTRIEALRRMRGQVMYDATISDVRHVGDSLADVQELSAWVGGAIARSGR